MGKVVQKTSINTLPTLLHKFYKEPFNISVARNVLLHPSLPPQEGRKALDHIKFLNQRSPNVYKYYLIGIARRGDKNELEKGIELVDKMGIKSEFGDWRDVRLLLHAARNELDPLFSIFSSAIVENKANLINPHDFTFCLRQIGGSRKDVLDMFEVVWREMRATGTKPELRVLNTFIQHYATLGEYEKVKEIIKQLRADGLQPNAFTYHYVITEAARRGETVRVLDWLGKMRDARVQPEIATFNYLVDWRAKMGDLAWAQKWVAEMRKSGLTPDVVTYTSLIGAAAKSGQMNLVKKWMEEMKGKGLKPNVVTYNSLVDAAAKSGDTETAQKWIEEMKNSGLNPDAATFNSLIKIDKQDTHWVDEMKKNGIKPTVQLYNSWISQASKEEDRNKVENLLEEMRKTRTPPNLVTFVCLVADAIRKGKNNTVKHWFGKMRKAGVPDAEMRRVLAEMLEKVKDKNGISYWIRE
eukprot:Phypoly_transcript_08085.p1 GENE.Phypoly_transcript_08085~~Phypoly_transcript_08085.p1  ORF type:complete len:468 (+),score=96.64 Phypoly_transcript_08085:138-1541(+)